MTATTSQNVTEWQWTVARHRAAALLADGVLTDEQIARQVGVTRRQLARWKTSPAFMARIATISTDAAKAICGEIIATKAGRLRVLSDLHDRLLTVVDARASVREKDRPWAPGETTGMIVAKEVIGESIVREATVDVGLVKQITALHDQARKELGEDIATVGVRHSGRVDHVHRSPALAGLTDDELDQLELIAQRVAGQPS